ncbi:MAG: SAM-dependent methyltransferase, partial [Thermacetogeniaceae bacterium]
MKRVHGIGVGPGNGEYITVKGYKLIREADVVFIPKSSTESFAGKIAKDYLKGKKVIELDFPMDGAGREKYARAAAVLDKELK